MTELHPASLSNQAPGAASMTTQATNGAFKSPELAQKFLKYSDSSPTPFHAVATSADMLQQAGFKRLREADVWDGSVERNGKYL